MGLNLVHRATGAALAVALAFVVLVPSPSSQSSALPQLPSSARKPGVITIPRRVGYVPVGNPHSAKYVTIHLTLPDLSSRTLAVLDPMFLKCWELCSTAHKDVCSKYCGSQKLTEILLFQLKRQQYALKYARHLTESLLSLGHVDSDKPNHVPPAAFLASSWEAHMTAAFNKETVVRNDGPADAVVKHWELYQKAANVSKGLVHTLLHNTDMSVFKATYPMVVSTYSHALDFVTAGLSQYNGMIQSCLRSILESKSVSGCSDEVPNGRFQNMHYDSSSNTLNVMATTTDHDLVIRKWADAYVPFWTGGGNLCWINLDLVSIENRLYYRPECDGIWCSAPVSVDVDVFFSGQPRFTYPHVCGACKGPVCYNGTAGTFAVLMPHERVILAVEDVHVRNATLVGPNEMSLEMMQELNALLHEVTSIKTYCSLVNKTASVVRDTMMSLAEKAAGIQENIDRIWNHVQEKVISFTKDTFESWSEIIYTSLALGVGSAVLTLMCMIVCCYFFSTHVTKSTYMPLKRHGR